MQKLYRNIFAAGVISLGLAACGDDVTVTPPPAPPTPGVTSVTVSPATQTISVGQTVVYGAAVVADVGITDLSVAWSSNNTTIATVNASTGAVTGVAPGTTTIVAKSNQDATRQGVATVTVIALPPGVTSFNATPPTISLLVGQTATGNITAVYAAGVTAPTITWSSLNTAVATVNSSTGLITAQAPGVAIVRASATLAADATRGTSAQSVTADITVTVAAAPSISINSITQGAITVPVNVNNAMGQIDINLNFNPRDQPIDEVDVFIDQPGCSVGTYTCPAAAKQVFNGNIPAAGILTLSVNTATYTKNYTAGTAAVSFLNGQTTVRAVIYRTGFAHSAPTVDNCSVSPNMPICAAPVALVLNNMDGWAADWGALVPATGLANQAKPATSAQGNTAPFVGLTFYGGPGTTGQLTATLYSVIYTPGRDISQVNWTVGTATSANLCATSAELLPGTPAVSNTRPWRRTFGYIVGVTPGQVACTAREWNGSAGGERDNVVVLNAIDNQSNAFVGTLIPNTVVFLSTPDSLRLDHLKSGIVSNPQVQGAEAFNWVNHNWAFKPSGTIVTDLGVGPLASSWAAFASANGGSNSTFPTAIVKGDLIAETNTNCLLPTGGCDGYTARATATDQLGNAANSGVTAAFGVDRTSPVVRYSCTTSCGVVPAYASGYILGGAPATLDSTAYAVFSGVAGAVYGVDVGAANSGLQNRFLSTAAGVADSFRIEGLDNRSGLSRAIMSTVNFSQPGTPAIPGTTTTISSITNGAFGAGLTDGFRPSPAFHVTNGIVATAPPLNPGYYTTVGYAMDRAGNVSGCPITGNILGTTGFLASVCVATAPSATSNTNPAVPAAGAGNNANLFIRRTLALDPGQPVVTGVSPNNAYTGNSSQTFTLGASNDLEVIDARLRLQYPNVTIGDAAGTITAAGGLVWSHALSATFGGFFPTLATRFDNSIIDPRLSSLVVDQFTLNVQETCVAAGGGFGTATGPTTATACGTTALWAGDPIPQSGAGSIPATKPNNVAVRVRDVFGSFGGGTVQTAIWNTNPGPSTGVSAEFVSAILPATVAAPGGYSAVYYNPGALLSCPAGGAVQPVNTSTCISSGINFRHDGGTLPIKNFRAVEGLSTTLPTFTRVELYALNNAGEWVFIQRCTVPAGIIPNTGPQACGGGTVTGTDNGLERYWVYSFTAIPSLPTGTGSGFFPAGAKYRALGVNAAGFGLFSDIQ